MGVSMHGVDGQPQPWAGTRGTGPYEGSLEVRHSSFLTNFGRRGRAGACY